MANQQNLVCVSGWGQRSDPLLGLEEHLSEFCPIHLTSVYELLEDDAGETDLAGDVFPPQAASVYAERLCQVLSPRAPSVLVGWSMGGLVALETAYFFPEMVAKLVLIGSTCCFCSKEDDLGVYRMGISPLNVRGMSIGLEKAARVTLAMFYQNIYPTEFDAAQLKEKTEVGLELDHSILQHGLRYLEKADLRGVLEDIAQPAFAIHGRRDKIISPDASDFLAQHLPDCSVMFMEQGCHALCEQCPGKVAAEIRTFLGL